MKKDGQLAMDRKKEIRELLKLSPQEVIDRAAGRLMVCEDLDELHRRFAGQIAQEISSHNQAGEPTRLIVPVGPTGQYPILAEIINNQKLSLADCWFFFMDEYCDEQGRAVSEDHPLSFKRQAKRLFLDRLAAELLPPKEHIIFPDQTNIDTLETLIEEVGGIDTCYGGIGIDGHVAFNEPQPQVKDTGPRRVRLNDFTVTINAIRAQVGGNLECFPREAYTLGMRQILGAKRIRLYSRSGCEFDWANTVLRVGLFGQPGDDYPATHIRGKEYIIITDRQTLACPNNLL